MRALFFLLLSANLAAAALIFLDSGRRAGAYVPEPLNAGSIRLLGAPGAVERPAAKPAACLEWGPFGSAELAAAESAVAGLELGERLARRVLEEDSSYWVYIPPLRTRQDADRKVAELRALGVTDYFLVQDGTRWNNAISLGIFRSEDAARGHLEGLAQKGVRSAVAGRRENLVKLTTLVVRDADDALAAKLMELRQAFPGSEVKAALCAGPGQG
jgi:hypothetical protein